MRSFASSSITSRFVRSWRHWGGGVALNPHRGDPASFVVEDLGGRDLRDGEPGGPDEPVGPVGPTLFEGVVHGGEDDLVGGELVVGFVGNQFLEPYGQVRDAQGPELLMVDAGEHQPCTPWPPHR